MSVKCNDFQIIHKDQNQNIFQALKISKKYFQKHDFCRLNNI
jgi:hypothetical protein